MRVLADLVGGQLLREDSLNEDRREKLARIRSVIERRQVACVFQPIVDLTNAGIVGAEALARFDAEPQRTPDLWFGEAWEVGLGVELELLTARTALAQLARFPEGAYVSFNVSPETLLAEAFFEVLAPLPPGRVVVELTEHMTVEEYEPLIREIRRLKSAGFRLAMDDVGAGYSGLSQILRISPNIVKLDLTLTRGIHGDRVRQALAAAAVAFASRVGNAIVAEGVETAEDMHALRVLGVRFG